MNYYSIICKDAPDSNKKRQALRTAHITRLQQLQVEQRLLIAGPYYAPNNDNNDAIEGHVTFSREVHDFHVHISVHVGHDIHAEGRAGDADAYGAFNETCEHVEKQLRRSKRKLREHH